MWTLFWDMHSGGGTKIGKLEKIYIEGDEEEARRKFQELFDRNPENVTCGCCGEDFGVHESATLEEASAYHRNCDWDKTGQKYLEQGRGEGYSEYQTLAEYLKREEVKVVYKD